MAATSEGCWAALLQLEACATPAALKVTVSPLCPPLRQPPCLTSLLCISRTAMAWLPIASRMYCAAERHEGRGGSTYGDCDACTTSSMVRT